jgi:hypothetical protein
MWDLTWSQQWRCHCHSPGLWCCVDLHFVPAFFRNILSSSSWLKLAAFRDVVPCSVVDTVCPDVEAVSCHEAFCNMYRTVWHKIPEIRHIMLFTMRTWSLTWRKYISLKHYYVLTRLHGVTTQKNKLCCFFIIKYSSFEFISVCELWHLFVRLCSGSCSVHRL